MRSHKQIAEHLWLVSKPNTGTYYLLMAAEYRPDYINKIIDQLWIQLARPLRTQLETQLLEHLKGYE